MLVGGLVNVGAFLNRRAAGPLSALVRKPDISSTGKAFLEGQFKDSLDQLVPDPGYAARLGFLHLVQEDMHRVLKLIATPKQPLVIFVDDLDPCSPGTVSQVIEAINLFLAVSSRTASSCWAWSRAPSPRTSRPRTRTWRRHSWMASSRRGWSSCMAFPRQDHPVAAERPGAADR